MSTQELTAPANGRRASHTLTIDLLVLDLTTCERCVGSDRNIETALDLVRDVLAATGASVEVRRTVVETAEQARALRFVSSPTIRIDGRDIALELHETPCESEACACAQGEPIACRVWTYRGREYTEAPVGLIVDAILAELYGAADPRLGAIPPAYELPEHLASFLERTSRAASDEGGCCGPQEQASCCEPAAKAACCGESPGGGCGCL